MFGLMIYDDDDLLNIMSFNTMDELELFKVNNPEYYYEYHPDN